jgi:oligopeptidase B
MLDQPRMAAGSGFFAIAGSQVSRNTRLLAYAEDTVGRRQYTLRFRDLVTGETLADVVPNVGPEFAWADDNKTIFYIEKDPVTLLSKRVKAHVLGTSVSADRLVYEEADASFYLSLARTADDRYVCIALQSTVSDEARCAPAASPATYAVMAPRKPEFRYNVDHVGDRWIIRTNLGAPNYKLVSVADAKASQGIAAWTDLAPASSDIFIEAFQPFDDFVAIEERAEGNKRLRLLSKSGASRIVASDEPAYSMTLDINPETRSDRVRYTYTSLTTPKTTYEVLARTGQRNLLKVQPVPGYDPSKYVTERIWINARDGTPVPVSLVHARSFRKDGTAPLYQYAYGSYGSSTDPEFLPELPSLLDRGFVYAIAHIRGGQEMGRRWYDDGHLMNKRNSFTDFNDVTRGLVARGYAAKSKAVAEGGSAGGLLMGAVANMAPDDYRVIIADVPFVDVVTTMLDGSIPLTTNEYDEWGNPAEKPAYSYMLSYSPYDNVAPRAYPSLFVTTGLWDSQVQYYEPAKWVAKLRATKTDSNPLVFRVNMEAGHGGKSGRFRRFEEQSESLAFALEQLGIRD